MSTVGRAPLLWVVPGSQREYSTRVRQVFTLAETRPRISAFFPMYNEEANVEATAMAAVAALEDLASEFEVILVDDGSTDRTAAIGAELSNAAPRIRVVTHPVNRGYGAALRTGFANARLDLVTFNDGDGQFDLRDLRELLEKIHDHEMVIGYRKQRADRLVRRLTARAWGGLVGILFGVWPRDLDCGFKLFQKKALDALDLRADGAFISTELLARGRAAGHRIAQVGVNHYPRRHGSSTGNNPRVVLRAFVEMISFWRELRRSKQ